MIPFFPQLHQHLIMPHYSDKGSSESEDKGSQTSQRSPISDRSSSGITHQQPQLPKTCADCGTTKTPLWRGGPAGPKSLCNACGIKSRKKRRALLGISSKEKDDKKMKKVSGTTAKRNNNNDSNNSGESTSTSADSTSMVGVYDESLKGGKLFLFGRGRDVAFQRPRSKTHSNSQRRKSGEEEQAAFLLMALSRGCVYS